MGEAIEQSGCHLGDGSNMGQFSVKIITLSGSVLSEIQQAWPP